MMNSIDISTSEEKTAYQAVLRRFSDSILGAHIFGRVLYLLQTIVGYTFVVCLGFAVGRLLGGYIGSIHAENIRHTINFLDFNQLREWQGIPWTFEQFIRDSHEWRSVKDIKEKGLPQSIAVLAT